VVTLMGHLGSFAEKYAIEHAVQRVQGVRAIGVELNVSLAPGHCRSDAEIALAEVAGAVGNSMFADLTSVAGSLYKFGPGRGLPGEIAPRRIAIHADEFNELIGDEFIPLLNKAGGAGFQVTAYTQTWSDVEARIGSPAKAGQIPGNFNTLIMLRVKEVATAELLTGQLPEVHVVSTIVSSSVSDTNDPGEFTDFASRNDDRIAPQSVRMLEPTDLVQLPKGQAFALIHGGQLHKIRMPRPDVHGRPRLPSSQFVTARR